MSGGRNRRGQAAAFSATAGEKNAFNISRTNQARSAGDLIAEPFGTAYYNLGSGRYAQSFNLPITRGNPEGFLDLEHKSGAELVRGLYGGQNLGTGIFLTNYSVAQEAASIIHDQLKRSDVVKFNEFKAAATSGTAGKILFPRDPRDGQQLTSDFKFTGTSTNQIAPPVTARRPTTPTSISVADATQEGKKRKNLGESRGGTLLTGNAGLSDSANTTKKTLLG
jgi:hypothetical protein